MNEIELSSDSEEEVGDDFPKTSSRTISRYYTLFR